MHKLTDVSFTIEGDEGEDDTTIKGALYLDVSDDDALNAAPDTNLGNVVFKTDADQSGDEVADDAKVKTAKKPPRRK